MTYSFKTVKKDALVFHVWHDMHRHCFVWHDSINCDMCAITLCVPWPVHKHALILHVWYDVHRRCFACHDSVNCDMWDVRRQWSVWHDSINCNMCDVHRHWYVWHDSVNRDVVTCVPCLVRADSVNWDMSAMHHHSSVWHASVNYDMCDTTRSIMWHDSFIHVKRLSCSYMTHDSSTWVILSNSFTCVTWIVQMCSTKKTLHPTQRTIYSTKKSHTFYQRAHVLLQEPYILSIKSPTLRYFGEYILHFRTKEY